MAKPIARVYGTALRPGVSRNGRYYSPEIIAAAVKEAQVRLAEGIRPMTMLTHHGADDDSTRIVGRLADLQLEADGSATYTAYIADTKHGKDIVELIDPEGDPPFLRGVSFRGDWVGPPRRITIDGQAAVTADGLEIDGLDFTRRPGIVGAGVEVVERIETTDNRESAPMRTRIYESVQEARVSTTAITEEATPAPAAAATVTESAPATQPAEPVQFADNGYLGEKRFPLDTAANVRAAYWAIRESETARQYSAAQLKRMRQRIFRGLREHDTFPAEGYLISRRPLTQAVAESYGWDYGEVSGHVYLTLDNGLVTISISSCRIDPHDLDRVARAAMEGACQALAVIDPDMDGDADPLESVQRRPTEAAPTPVGLAETDVTAPAGADPHPDEEEPAVSEPTTPAVATTPAATTSDQPAAPAVGITLTDDQFAQLLARVGTPAGAPAAAAPQPEFATAGTPAESAPAPAAPVTEAAPPAAMTADDVARLIKENVDKARVDLVQDLTQQGLISPSRRGLVVGTVTESAPAGEYPEGWPTENGAPKPAHKLSEEEWSKHVGQGMTLPAVLGNRA